MNRAMLFTNRFSAFLGLLALAGCAKPANPVTQKPTGADRTNQVAFTTKVIPGISDSGSSEPDALQGEPARTGRIAGRVKWLGPVPTPDRNNVTSEQHACAEHGRHDRQAESLVVNPSNGGLQNSVVHLTGTFERTDDRSGTEPRTLNQRQCSYEPRVMVIPVGTRLAMTSEDEVGHNIRMTGAAELNIAISKGGRTSRRLDQPGIIKIGCDIHPWMSAFIHVVKHSYYALTDADGGFELADVPAGQHTIRLWHEGWSGSEPLVASETVTVEPGSTTQVTIEVSGS